MRKKARTSLLSVAVGLFLVVLLVPAAIGMAADWLWFSEIGFERVFLTEILAKLGVFLVVATLAFALLYLNLRIAQRGVVPHPIMVDLGEETPPLNVTDAVRRFALPGSLLLAVLIGLGATSAWMPLLQWVHRVPFGTPDPVFGLDVGFYVFTLPVLAFALGLVFSLLVLALLLVVALYWLRRDIIVASPHVRVEPSAGVHLGVLVAALFATLALQIWALRVPGLLQSTTGPLVGASYTDLHARLPALYASAVAALLAGGFVLWGAMRQQLIRHVGVAVAGYVAVSLLARGAYPGAVQRFVVEPTELTREAPHLRHHIAATRRAWGLDNVQVRELSGDATLAPGALEANAATIENVRLWERAPLLQTLGQLQEIRTYYDFVSLDDDRYRIGGRLRQVLLSPRELNSASLPQRNFINEHLIYTHGMGVALAPVNQVTAEGLPVLFVRDLPPRSDISIQVTRPQIYYGELTNSHAIVGTRQPEFDYPSGEAAVTTRYAGRGGVPMNSLLRRALMAVRFGSINILFSGDLTPESRILFHRNVAERAQKALPFLRWDGDPYLVVTEAGEMKWILDAYTHSSRYPYAQRLSDGTSYMRNSVKVVIDAYDGDVQAFVADPADPLVRTHARVFSGILRPLDEMPADLRAHIRYPKDLYRIQTALYTVFHLGEAETFYNREDQWQTPVMNETDRSDTFLRHMVMRLPDEAQEEYILMTPFTPRQKDNLAAWMVARNDGDRYGELVVYRFPRQSLVFGPRQIDNRINQDTDIAQQLSLWDQRGSEVIRGELLVIPLDESLIYVQPIYLRAQGGRIPELKRVVAAYQNQVVWGETLEEALQQLFVSGAAAAPALEAGVEPPAVAAQP
ncbi:MAG: UPF0182 family protein, partial [Gemmatimonadota bacterium]|nr:UPF0182 family protein [Gemmatimonadota bacterium]